MSSLAQIPNLDFDVRLQELLKAAAEVVLDKEVELRLSVSCLLAGGHLLVEDRPGMGKTILVKTLAKLFGLESQRVQFTNDLLPSDILGTSIFNPETRKFEFHKGPIFANFVLADEINRATPKTQSACLQAMEEYSVSVDGHLHSLPSPFFFVATQNPQDNIGTFPLPESQVDRFLMRIELGLPSREAERAILVGKDRNKVVDKLSKIFSPRDVSQLIEQVQRVHCSNEVLDYLQDIVEKSRTFSQGLSPRAAKGFHAAAKAWAFCLGRDFVIPEDVQAVAVSVMNHRLTRGDDFSSAKGRELAHEIIHSVPVP